MPPVVPEYVTEGLADIRETLELRWNPKAKLLNPGHVDATGKVKDPEYDSRWEVWDTDPEGAEYMVMRLQTMDGAFRAPGEWLLRRMKFLNPARWPSLDHMIKELVEEPEIMREAGTQEDSDDFLDAVSKAAAWHETPKSAAGLSFRGKKMLSA